MALLPAPTTPALLPTPRRPRRAAAAGVLLGVLLLHLWLAGFWGLPRPAPPGRAGQPVMQVLRVEVAPAGPADTAPAVGSDALPSVLASVPPGPEPLAPVRAVPELARTAPTSAPPASASPTHALPADLRSTELAANDDADAEAAPGSPGTAPPPLYATRLPESTALNFTLQRGAASGEARLQWHAEGERYAMQFDARLAGGLPLIEQRSAGQLDGNGLAPDRFTDRRRGRAMQAANFQRDTGRITFSRPRIEYPAWPGAQDRLGWIVQMAAIFSAAREPPSEVTLFVVGARGGAGLWTFRLQGTQTVQTPLGPVAALYLRRDPERAEDQRVEVWLDPLRGHWPVRLRSTPIRGGEPLELLLAAEPARP